MSFVFCSDDYLLDINQRFLKHDYFTDIITFQQAEEGFVSGDLMISVERVLENSKSLNIRFVDELHRVMIHGVLHLCGYSDKSVAQKANMRAKEDQYLRLRPEALLDAS